MMFSVFELEAMLGPSGQASAPPVRDSMRRLTTVLITLYDRQRYRRRHSRGKHMMHLFDPKLAVEHLPFKWLTKEELDVLESLIKLIRRLYAEDTNLGDKSLPWLVTDTEELKRNMEKKWTATLKSCEDIAREVAEKMKGGWNDTAAKEDRWTLGGQTYII